jgi:ABC-type Fe3+ transport system permease subunit
LWIFFITYAATLILALCLAIAVATGLAVPLNVWLFTSQWKWVELNDWLANILLSIPIGLMAAGIFTAYEWYRRSVLPVIRKGIIAALVYSVIIVAALFAAKGVRVLFPIHEKPEKPATIAKPVSDGWKYVPVEVLPPLPRPNAQPTDHKQ